MAEQQRKDVSSNSVLARNGNGSYRTEERQGHNGTATAKWQWQKGKTEHWKLGIRVRYSPISPIVQCTLLSVTRVWILNYFQTGYLARIAASMS